jgi:hypothetical protein
VAAVLLLAATAAAPGAGFPTLYVNYTMNCTFSIVDDSGKAVTSIAPGQYQVAVNAPASFGGIDLSGKSDMTACKGFVQFELSGPGVDIKTTLDDGDGSYAMLSGTFKPSSTYTAVDNNQPSVAKVSFTTLAGGTPSTPPATTPSSSGSSSSGSGAQAGAVIGTLAATVAPTGKLTFVFKGKPVTRIKPGQYKVTVTDKSTKSGFYLRHTGSPTVAVAAGPFVGTHSATVNLLTGVWFYSPSSSGAKTPFTVAA